MSHNKLHLPSKICLACKRPFNWRKKWARVWDQIRYCSKACGKTRSSGERMKIAIFFLSCLLACSAFAQETSSNQPDPLASGNHTIKLTVDDRERTCVVHVPEKYDLKTPTPLVLALHGAGMDGSMMVWFSGLDKKSDEAGFIVAYPSGTGVGPLCTWNAGGFSGRLAEGRPDDVKFIDQLLDQISNILNIDGKRIYACGMSNGGMMCYRLASELSNRIAAIAPVAGTIAIDECKPNRPVPVIHFHGLKDKIVPYEMGKGKSPPFMKLRSVEDSVLTWVKLNGCDEKPTTETISKDGDEMTVTRKTYYKGKDGAEVVLVVIEEGGHTWPGQKPPLGIIGKSAKHISANDLIWEFFQKHPMK